MANNLKGRMKNFLPEEIPELMIPHIELCSQKKAVIEGCKGILEYTGETVRLNCKGVILSFTGENLCLSSLSDEVITVTGKICEINFI